jgi:hypothetical protein
MIQNTNIHSGYANNIPLRYNMLNFFIQFLLYKYDMHL